MTRKRSLSSGEAPVLVAKTVWIMANLVRERANPWSHRSGCGLQAFRTEGSSWIVNFFPAGRHRRRIDKIVSSVDTVPRPGHRSTETPLSQRGTSANRCARTAELPRVESDLHRKCSQLLALVRNRKLELPPLKDH